MFGVTLRLSTAVAATTTALAESKDCLGVALPVKEWNHTSGNLHAFLLRLIRCERELLKAVVYVLDKGVDCKAYDNEAITAVAARGHAGILKELLVRGATLPSEQAKLDYINHFDVLSIADCFSPLHLAARCGSIASLDLLLPVAASSLAALNPLQRRCFSARLFSAAAAGNHCHVLSYLLEQKVEPWRHSLVIPLSLAAKFGHLDAVIWLSEHAVDPSSLNGWTEVVALAAQNRHLNVLHFLLQRAPHHFGSALVAAVRSGSLEVVNMMAQHQAFSGHTASRIRTAALKHACSDGRLDMVRVLADGALEDALNAGFMLAVRRGHVDICRLFLDRGAYAQTRSELLLNVCTQTASPGVEIVAELLLSEHKASVDTMNSLGLTPLHLAASQNEALTRTLLRHGANVNAVGNHGETPLDCVNFSVPLVSGPVTMLLLDRGATYGKMQRSMLLEASMRGHARVVQWLLEHGHSVSEVDAEQNTALHLAFSDDSFAAAADVLEVVKLLVPAGADVNAANGNGDTPLHLAVRHRASMDIVDYLLGNGADPRRTNKSGTLAGFVGPSVGDPSVSALPNGAAHANVNASLNSSDNPRSSSSVVAPSTKTCVLQ